MPERNAENNRVSVIGVVVSGFEFSHEVFGESFYIMELSVNRLSDQSDTIPVMISERHYRYQSGLQRTHNGSNRTVSFL